MDNFRKNSVNTGFLRERALRHKRIARKRKIKRLFSRFLTALVPLLLILTLNCGIISFAGQETADVHVMEKVYTSIMVYPGDSIDSIAAQYETEGFEDRDSLKHEIISINHLDYEGTLSAGNHIIVPVYR